MSLPTSWTVTPLSDLLDQIVGGGTPSKAVSANFLGAVPFMTVKDMKSRFIADTVDHISEEAVLSSATTKIPADTLVVATRMSLGKIARPSVEVAINQDLKALFPCKGVDKTYLEYFWRSKSNFIQSKGTGTTVKGIRIEDIKNLETPLAPEPEQRRIAKKLDTILTRVDALNDRLARITPLLKRFRQSVLAAATSGRLTEDWRISGIAPETTDNILWSIPSNWQWTPAENICTFITKGTTPSKSAMTANQGEVPYIKVYNLTFDGSLDFTIEPTFIPRAVHETDLKRSRCLPGDVLMNIVGPPLGKVSVVPHGYSEWNINQAIARFRPEGVQSAYLSICLRNPSLISHAVSRAKATAGQFNLTLEICRGLPIPVPPVEEQTEIVRRVEILFAYADRLEARLQTARTAADRLTPALLAKAFRGELVPQDPNDEPATELLRRLRAARASEESQSPTRASRRKI